MHQYGLHRDLNNTAGLCVKNETLDLPMQKCYWTKPRSLQTYMPKYYTWIYQPGNDKTQVCESFPPDLTDYLNRNEVSSSDDENSDYSSSCDKPTSKRSSKDCECCEKRWKKRWSSIGRKIESNFYASIMTIVGTYLYMLEFR